MLRERVRNPNLVFERTEAGLSVDLPCAAAADYFFRVVCHPGGSRTVAAISTVSGVRLWEEAFVRREFEGVRSISAALGLRLWQLCHRPTRILEIEEAGEIVRMLEIGSGGDWSHGRLSRESRHHSRSRREIVYNAPLIAPEPAPPR
jgi:hypothetical protein